MTGVERWARWLSRAGLAVIAAVTFVTSFDAVSAVGAERGAVSPQLAWAVPLALDGLIVVGSAVAWVESLRGGRWHPFPVTLVAVAGALSVAANVAHAPGTDPLAKTLAAVPPVALLCAVELGAWQLRREARRQTRDTAAHAGDNGKAAGAAVTGGTPAGDSAPAVTAGPLDGVALPAVPGDLSKVDRAKFVLEQFVAGGGDLAADGLAKAVAARADCHTRTAYRALETLEPAMNGSRPQETP